MAAGSASLRPALRAPGPGRTPGHGQHSTHGPSWAWLGWGRAGASLQAPLQAALGHAVRLWVGDEMRQKGLLGLVQVRSGG